MRNFSPLEIYRLYSMGAYLDVRASLFIYSATGTALKVFGAGERRRDTVQRNNHLGGALAKRTISLFTVAL